MQTVRTIIQRLFFMVVVVTLATFLLSLLVRLLPGDPIRYLIPLGSDEAIEQARRATGLDRGIFGYFWKWYSGMWTGDFGSYFAGETPIPLAGRIAATLPVTLLIILYTQVVALFFAVPLGLVSAFKEGSRFDRIVQNMLFTLSSIPGFALGLVLIIVLAAKFHVLDPGGYISPSDNFGQHLKFMIMPVISLAIGPMASYTRLLRADVIATLKEDYVTMAASKGISNRRVLWRHVLRPSSTTLLTSAALNMGALIGGTIIVETIFTIPGMGWEVSASVIGRQVIAVQTYVAIISFGYVLFNSIVDIITNIIDPRTRERRV